MEPECNFWGIKIAPGEGVEVAPEWKEDFIVSIHLTNVALGDKPKPGGHTVFVEKDGEKFALGTLDREKCTHFSLDIHLATDSITLSHTGKSDVYVTGYEAVSVAGEEEGGGLPFPLGMRQADSDEEAGSEEASGSEEEEEDSEEEEEEESSDEEEAPQGVPIANGKKQVSRQVLVDDEAEEASSDEADEGDGEEEEESEDEDEIDGLVESEEEEGGSSEEGGEDEEDSEDEEEESSEEEEPRAPPPKVGDKRSAQKQPAATPQPSKRERVEAMLAARAAPATAPPKAAKGPPGSSEYLAALKTYLQAKGPTKLANLGSAVKRPPKVPKLKHFIAEHAKVFKYSAGDDTVALA